jgi:hypothetical protein
MMGPRNLARTALAVFLLLSCAGTTATALQPQKSSSGTPRSPQPRKAKPKPDAPVPPPQVASPKVSYKDGLLSIAANDALLRDVLAQLHQRTGVTFEGSADMNDRVTVDLGPGPAVQIVAAFLEQTGYNFVITTAARDPRLLESIQLTRKPSLLENLVPAGIAEEERAPAPPPAAKPRPKATDDNGWTEEPPASTTPPPLPK